MSERQVKKDKKNIGEIKIKRPVDKTTVLINVIVTIVILVVLGLGVYAVGSKYMENHAADTQSEQAQTTVADFIAEKGITLDEFKTEYGLEGDEDVTEESNMSAVSGKFTLENYAKYTDTTLEDLKAQYGLGDDVPNTTTWQDAISYMTTGVVAQNFFGMDFETFKTQMGLPDTVTAETPWSDAQNVLNEISQQQTAENADDTSADNSDVQSSEDNTQEPAPTATEGE